MALPLILVAVFLLSGGSSAMGERDRGGPGDGRPFALMVGDKAPPLPDLGWVRGQEIREFESGHVYVLYLWTTWCAPCIAAFPDLSKLQGKYQGDVTVIGVNTWEINPKKVPALVEARAEEIAFSVCMDSVPDGSEANQGAISKQWLYGSGSTVFPTVFIIDRAGRIAWIGHKDFDAPLAQVVSGGWNVEAAARDHAERMAEQAIPIRLDWRVDSAVVREDWEVALRGIDSLLATDQEEHRLVARNHLAVIATTLARPEVREGDLRLALECAKRAIALSDTKPSQIYDILGQIHFLRGEVEDALRAAEEAVNSAPPGDVERFQRRLMEYRSQVDN